MSNTRPLSPVRAIVLAFRAARDHYRFARRPYLEDAIPDGLGLVVTTRAPRQSEMDRAGGNWCEWNRMQGTFPTDPAVIWRDMAVLWAALHRTRQELREAKP